MTRSLQQQRLQVLTSRDMFILCDLGFHGLSHGDVTKTSLKLDAFPQL
jgi:hypothetical protein